MNPSDLPERIASKITHDPLTGCWIWTAARTISRNPARTPGYGKVRWNGSLVVAHRLVYRLLVDPTLPLNPGWGKGSPQLDHVADRCATGPACVNPAHLEPVSLRTNIQRSARNKYGFTGVGPTVDGKYYARIDLGREFHLGRETTPRAAGLRYDAACVAIGAVAANHAAGRLPAPDPALIRDVRERLTNQGLDLHTVPVERVSREARPGEVARIERRAS